MREVGQAGAARGRSTHGRRGHGRGPERGDAFCRAVVALGHHLERGLGRRVHVLDDARGMIRQSREQRLARGAVCGARPVADDAAERQRTRITRARRLQLRPGRGRGAEQLLHRRVPSSSACVPAARHAP